jgi:hypothetical protein
LASRFGTDLERFSAQVCRLIGCCVLAFAKATFGFLQDWPDGIRNLIQSGGRASGSALTGAISYNAEFLLNAAQMLRNGGNARFKLR